MELCNIERFEKSIDNNDEYLNQLRNKYNETKEYSDFHKIIDFYNVDNGVIKWNWCLEKIFEKNIFKKNSLQLITQNYEIYYYKLNKDYFQTLLDEAKEFLITHNDHKEEIKNTIQFFSDAINDNVEFVRFKLDTINHHDFLLSEFQYTTN